MSSAAIQESTLTAGTAGRELAVRCRGVVKAYGSGTARVQALRGIDLDIYTSELMMLVGPSGCGKTTLISVVAGVLDRDGGECAVFGTDFDRLGASERTRFRGRNIGFVFQAFNLIPTLTIAENVSVPLLLQGQGRHAAVKQAREILAEVGLGERTESYPSKLSGGQQQRVAIARALIHGPRLIVCDEPTSALDHVTGQKIMEMLRGICAQKGTTLVVVTHDSRIFQYADRIAHMDDGQVDKIMNSANEATGASPASPERSG